MWSTHTQTHATRDRGRSRDVSPVALARRAEEERRKDSRRHHAELVHRQTHSMLPQAASCSSTLQSSSDSFHGSAPSQVPEVTPPAMFHGDSGALARSRGGAIVATPSQSQPVHPTQCSVAAPFAVRSESPDECPSVFPRSLQDQMQVAYALDDMHLARVLFLKLQGVEVTSDDDPRIAEVRDEDFCFVPGGSLVLDEETEQMIREGQRRDREKWKQLEEERALQEREKVWEQESKRLRLAKLKAQRLKQEDSSGLGAQLQRTISRTQPQTGKVLQLTGTEVVSRVSVDLHIISRPSVSFHVKPQPVKPQPVTFKDVLSSMQGSLFPLDDCQDRAARKQTKSQREHLKTLLKVVVWEDGERKRVKGKGREREVAQTCVEDVIRKSTNVSCVACSKGTESTISRTNSWASSDSEESVSTILTSPPTSPFSDCPPLPLLMEDSKFKAMVHSCCQRSKLTAVPLRNSPLCPEELLSLRRPSGNTRGDPNKGSSKGPSDSMITRVRKSVSSFFEFAATVHSSYIRTVQYAVASSPSSYNETLDSYRPQPNKIRKLEPEGYRASPADVSLFIPSSHWLPAENDIFHRYLICLDNQLCVPSLRRTFASHPHIPPSPLRPRFVPDSPECRVRPIANPVLWRLKALQNLLGARGMAWEGRAPIGSLGCGRDKLTGIAVDGIGRSSLAFEVKFESNQAAQDRT